MTGQASRGDFGLRGCSRNGCNRPAVATLTYSYADSTVVLGPLSSVAEPQAYDLCAEHAQRLTVPRGWEVVRLPLRESDLRRTDDLLDIADALRPPAQPPATPSSTSARRPVAASQPPASGRHLRPVNENESDA